MNYRLTYNNKGLMQGLSKRNNVCLLETCTAVSALGVRELFESDGQTADFDYFTGFTGLTNLHR